MWSERREQSALKTELTNVIWELERLRASFSDDDVLFPDGDEDEDEQYEDDEIEEEDEEDEEAYDEKAYEEEKDIVIRSETQEAKRLFRQMLRGR